MKSPLQHKFVLYKNKKNASGINGGIFFCIKIENKTVYILLPINTIAKNWRTSHTIRETRDILYEKDCFEIF